MTDQSVLARPADDEWLRDARTARALSLVTLAWLGAESALGLTAGLGSHSVALIGWGTSALVEALASLIVVWRFTGSRTLSRDAEGKARRAVAISFWLLAPYLVLHVAYDLQAGHRATPSALGVQTVGRDLTWAFSGGHGRRPARGRRWASVSYGAVRDKKGVLLG